MVAKIVDRLSSPDLKDPLNKEAIQPLLRVHSALLALGQRLQARDYRFVVPGDLSYQRMHKARAQRIGDVWSDVFGWSLPIARDRLPDEVWQGLAEADELDRLGAQAKSRVRVGSVGDKLFFHSAHNAGSPHAVPFGPDVYRYLGFLNRQNLHGEWLAELHCGAGAGALSLASSFRTVSIADVQARSLLFARVNAELQGIKRVQTQICELPSALHAPFDVLIANVPYASDAHKRALKLGVGRLGADAAVRIVREGLARLPSGGRLVLYTAVPVTAGVDPLLRDLQRDFHVACRDVQYDILDSDVGLQLDEASLDAVDSVQAVGLSLVKK